MSTLFERMEKPCTMRVLDGETWVDGAKFDAAIVKNASFEARIAERDTGKAAYTITTKKALAYHDVFRRDEDGQTFRVTGSTDGSASPACASFSFLQAQAELWEEPA
jgi:hypothetical protein